jgi:hypothetical protein
MKRIGDGEKKEIGENKISSHMTSLIDDLN